jgi:hypothetical protein
LALALLLAKSLADFSQSQVKTKILRSQHTKHDTGELCCQKSLDEKYSQLQKTHSTTKLSLEKELEVMEEKLRGVLGDWEVDKKRIVELTDSYMDKARQLQKLQVKVFLVQF